MKAIIVLLGSLLLTSSAFGCGAHREAKLEKKKVKATQAVAKSPAPSCPLAGMKGVKLCGPAKITKTASR